MKLLITGSSGFLGQYVVAAALQRGHQVRAVRRPRPQPSSSVLEGHDAVEIYEADLSDLGGKESMLEGVEGIIHLAASKSGNFDDAYQGTVVTTQNLLALVEEKPTVRFVLASSLSVYDYSKIAEGATLDETTAIGEHFTERDAYAQTKLLQERCVRDFATHHPHRVSIIRPGMIFGREALWNACHGAGAGPLWLLIGARHTMPLTYVENCAEAIVLAAENEAATDKTFNIIDDDLPTRLAYTEAIRSLSDQSPRIVLVNQSLLEAIAAFADSFNKVVLGNRLKLPGLLIPARLDARFKSLSYSNVQAKTDLNWHPRYGWMEALQRCRLDDMALFMNN